jgi:hypothetical protein
VYLDRNEGLQAALDSPIVIGLPLLTALLALHVPVLVELPAQALSAQMPATPSHTARSSLPVGGSDSDLPSSGPFARAQGANGCGNPASRQPKPPAEAASRSRQPKPLAPADRSYDDPRLCGKPPPANTLTRNRSGKGR